jgi:hypothetical protein
MVPAVILEIPEMVVLTGVPFPPEQTLVAVMPVPLETTMD